MTRIIVICGPPGSGKGVQCKMLVKQYGFVHLSTGDIFREAILNQTDLGKKADKFIRKGLYVPDELVTNLVKERLQMPDVVANGVLLDGFPRTANQAKILSSLFDVERFILVQSSDITCIDRVLGRRVDPISGNIYHLQYMPPETQEISSRLIRREYDLEENIIRARLNSYYIQLGQMIPYFRGKIQILNGFHLPSEVHQELCELLDVKLQVVDDNSREENSTQISPPDMLCSVCVDAPADYIVVPCGHQCGCETCLTSLRATSGCPICRGSISNIIRVYKCGVDDNSIKASSAADDEYLVARAHIDQGSDWDTERRTEQKSDWDEDNQILKDVSVSITTSSDKKLTNIGIKVPELISREPVDICCVVDVSGSMGTIASYEDEAGHLTDDGLSMLDIVKHAVTTVMHLLNENDRLVICL